MSGTPNTIFVEPAGRQPFVRERLAVAAFTPGHLLQNVAAGFQKHGTAAINAQKIFAMENEADAGTIDRAYVANETARGGYAQRGDLVYAWIPAAAAAIVVGDALESAGDGTLRKAATDTATDTTQRDSIVGYAAEAKDNSAGGSAVRLLIEVA